MKKIIALIFVICTLISSTCIAFETPNPNRWFWIDSDDRYGLWIDKQSLRSNYKGNKEYVNVWWMIYDAGDGSYEKHHWNCDVENRMFKKLGYVKYNSNDQVVDSYNFRYLDYESPTPETIGEIVLDFTIELNKLNKLLKNKELIN